MVRRIALPDWGRAAWVRPGNALSRYDYNFTRCMMRFNLFECFYRLRQCECLTHVHFQLPGFRQLPQVVQLEGVGLHKDVLEVKAGVQVFALVEDGDQLSARL